MRLNRLIFYRVQKFTPLLYKSFCFHSKALYNTFYLLAKIATLFFESKILTLQSQTLVIFTDFLKFFSNIISKS